MARRYLFRQPVVAPGHARRAHHALRPVLRPGVGNHRFDQVTVGVPGNRPRTERDGLRAQLGSDIVVRTAGLVLEGQRCPRQGCTASST